MLKHAKIIIRVTISALAVGLCSSFAVAAEGNIDVVKMAANTMMINRLDDGWRFSALRGINNAIVADLRLVPFNVKSSVGSTLSAEEQAKLNNAQANAAASINAVINAWYQSFGRITTDQANTTGNSKLDYITQQVLCWGGPSLTLAKLRNSRNPNSLIPNAPYAAQSVISYFSGYLGATRSVTAIQDKVALQYRRCR